MGRVAVQFLGLSQQGHNDELNNLVVIYLLHPKDNESMHRPVSPNQWLFFDSFHSSVLCVKKARVGSARAELKELRRGEDTIVTLMLSSSVSATVRICPFDFGIVDNDISEPVSKAVSGTVLDVEVFSARDLAPHDLDRLNDCFVIVRYADFFYETSKVSDDNTPRWENEDCSFEINPNDRKLTVELWDYDTHSKNDLCGVVTIDLDSVKQGIEWFPIEKRSLIRFGKSKGFVKISLGFNSRPELGLISQSIPFRLQTFDLVLFDIPLAIGNFISVSTQSRWDHAGMIVENKEKDALFILEATRKGVVLWPLDDRLNLHYFNIGTIIGIRRVFGTRSPDLISKLDAFIDENTGKSYEADFFQLAMSAFRGNSEEDLESLFCSELVAAAYQNVGLLAKDQLSNNFAPKDLSHLDSTLLRGATLGPLKYAYGKKQ